jgi:hypothetical protein
MPRCKALVRGGSRRCRNQAAPGQAFCPLHNHTKGVRAATGTAASYPRSPAIVKRSATSHRISQSRAVPKGRYQTIRNPHFGIRDVVAHVVHDKVSDAARTTAIAYGVQSVTAPLVMLGPPGFVARSGLTIGLTMQLSHAANIYDTGRDLYQFAKTGEVHGKRIYAHEYVS